MGLHCLEKSRALSRHFMAVAKHQGCSFLDAEGKAEFNRLDCMHLTRKGHAQLAHELQTMIPSLLS